jgi:exosortase
VLEWQGGEGPVTTAVAPVGTHNPLGDLRDWGRRLSPRHKVAARIAIFFAAVLVAYHYSLISLLQSLGLETPLAYVGLAPVIAVILAGLRSRTAKPGPAIYDRQVDYIVGVPLLAVALAINAIFPRHLSTMFWVWRIDLFSLPFFVAGSVCVLFGIRTMWQQRLAIVFLFLAWPLPYQVLLSRFLNDFTNTTLAGLKRAVHLLPVAKVVPVADGSLFQITHAGQSFQISVVSACSGVNGMVGFLLVGAAFGAIVRGPRLRKALWLSGGLLVLWVMNLARILFIFWAGQTWGSHVAIGFLHPFIGLLSFNLGIVVMLLALRPFRLSIDGGLWSKPAAPTQLEDDDSASHATVSGSQATAAPRRVMAVPRVGVALVLVVVLAGSLSVLDSHLRSYDLVANALGTPRLASFSDYPATPDGWRAQKSDEFDWAKPYFGQSSTWLRYALFPGASSSIPLQSSQAVTADVISTSNLRAFSAYGVDACYRFHGYKLRDIATVSLGGGVTGQALSFYNGKQQEEWTVVYWVWPVRTATSTRYERVTLYIQDTAQTNFPTPTVINVNNIRGGLSGTDPVSRKLLATRSFITAVARQVVHNQAAVKVGTTLPASSNSSVGAGGPLVPRLVNGRLRLVPAATAAPAASTAQPQYPATAQPPYSSAIKAIANAPWLRIRTSGSAPFPGTARAAPGGSR